MTEPDPIAAIRIELATTSAALARAEEHLRRLTEQRSQMASSPDRLTYNLDEAAQALGISRTTLWRLHSDGEIHVTQIGSRKVIARTELERFLTKGRAA